MRLKLGFFPNSNILKICPVVNPKVGVRLKLGVLRYIAYLETECRLFPPVTIFLDLFPCAGYFFNALY